MDELWKIINEAPKYEISNLARVRNIASGVILRQNLIGKTPTVNLQAAGKVMCRSVPKLVREVFGA